MSNIIIKEEFKSLASPAMLDAMDFVQETLESIENPRLPRIKFKEDFRLAEGEEPVDSFEAIILYVKNSNSFYKKPYSASNTVAPDCSSSDGKFPDNGDNRQNVRLDDKGKDIKNEDETGKFLGCKTCKWNQWDSDLKGGKGKACKNSKMIYLRFEGAIIPKVLSIPPTSIGNIDKYLLELASTGGMSKFLTKFEVYKMDSKQDHYNIKLLKVKPLTEDAQKDTLFVKKVWESYMKGDVVHGEN